jgi:phage-related protein (TIGR01555 family)
MTKRKPSALKLSRGDSVEARTRKLIQNDGWMNIYSGMGISGTDKQLGTSFGRVPRLYETELTDLYRGDGFAKRTIDLPTGEMLREGFVIHGDTDNLVNAYLEHMRAKQEVLMALRWARLYGGGLLVMLINDGGKLDTPLNEGNIRSIEQMRVYDRYRVTWTTADLYEDPENPKFGQLEYYSVSPTSMGGVIPPFRVHESRCLRFDGMPVNNKIRQENNGWGDSIFQSIYRQLADLTGSYHASKEVIDDFIQIIVKIDNLQELIAAGKEDLVKQRINIMDMGRHVMNTIMLDTKEEYSKEASRVAGLDALLGKFAEAYSAVTEIPLTLLMGQTPKGFNAKDDGSMRKWYDKIAEDQEDELRQQLERLVYLIMLSKEGPTNGKVLEDWSLEFNPLWQPTEIEVVEMRNKQAETDKIYIENQVLTPEEVTVSRFGGDEYSIETSVDIDARKPIEGNQEPDDSDTVE